MTQLYIIIALAMSSCLIYLSVLLANFYSQALMIPSNKRCQDSADEVAHFFHEPPNSVDAIFGPFL